MQALQTLEWAKIWRCLHARPSELRASLGSGELAQCELAVRRVQTRLQNCKLLFSEPCLSSRPHRFIDLTVFVCILSRRKHAQTRCAQFCGCITCFCKGRQYLDGLPRGPPAWQTPRPYSRALCELTTQRSDFHTCQLRLFSCPHQRC